MQYSISDLKSRVQLTDLIGQYVQLKRQGSSWFGLCPFHADNKPTNFNVDNKRGTYKCFACGAQGDHVTFLENHLSLDTKEAIAQLAKEAGVDLTPGQPAPAPRPKPVAPPVAATKQPRFIPRDHMLSACRRPLEQNPLIAFLVEKIGAEVLKQAERYHVSHGVNDTTVFWHVDLAGNVRTGKIMNYDRSTGKRIKGELAINNWVHALKIKTGNEPPRRFYPGENDEYKFCFFGEHLLASLPKDHPVILVEAQKTALALAASNPSGPAVLATAGTQTVNAERCLPLAGRNVCILPDEDIPGRQAVGLLPQFQLTDPKDETLRADVAAMLLQEFAEQYADAPLMLEPGEVWQTGLMIGGRLKGHFGDRIKLLSSARNSLQTLVEVGARPVVSILMPSICDGSDFADIATDHNETLTNPAPAGYPANWDF